MRHHLLFLPLPALAVVALLSHATVPPVQADPGGMAAIAALPERNPEKRKIDNRFSLHTLRQLKAKLDDSDRVAALRALHLALTRISDGATFVWRKRSRQLAGVIKPTAAFRNANGQVCRHLIYSLSLGRYIKSIESVACRDAKGRWQLSS